MLSLGAESAGVESGLLPQSPPLSLRKRFYPLGCRLDLSTNAEGIAATAAGLWSRYPELSDLAPIHLDVSVASHRASVPPIPASLRARGHLVTIFHGPENNAVADLSRGIAHLSLTRDLAGDSAWVAYHFLEPLACMMLAARHFVYVHASSIAWEGRALLLCGESGSGKTCLAYACARRGWTFLSGDAVQIPRAALTPTVVGRPYSIRFRDTAANIFPELRAHPALRRPNGKLDIEVASADLRLAVALTAPADRIVFLNRVEGVQRASIDPVERGDARQALESTICYGDDAMRSAQRHSLEQFLVTPAFRLTYSGLDDAEAALRALAASTGK